MSSPALIDDNERPVLPALNVVDFDIRRVLARFFSLSEIGVFQDWQLRTGMIISGSIALQVVSPSSYDTDLDCFCFVNNCLPIGQWLEQLSYEHQVADDGLSFTDSFSAVISRINGPEDDDDSSTAGPRYNLSGSVVHVWSFIRGGSVVQLVAVAGAPVSTVLSFHSTGVMNFITHLAFYSLYPRATFRDRYFVKCHRQGSDVTRSEIARTKYVHRGWAMLSQPPWSSLLVRDSEFNMFRSRYVGDAACQVVPVVFHGSMNGANVDDNVRSNSWELSFHSEHAEMVARDLVVGKAPRLYPYVLSLREFAELHPNFNALTHALPALDSEVFDAARSITSFAPIRNERAVDFPSAVQFLLNVFSDRNVSRLVRRTHNALSARALQLFFLFMQAVFDVYPSFTPLQCSCNVVEADHPRLALYMLVSVPLLPEFKYFVVALAAHDIVIEIL